MTLVTSSVFTCGQYRPSVVIALLGWGWIQVFKIGQKRIQALSKILLTFNVPILGLRSCTFSYSSLSVVPTLDEAPMSHRFKRGDESYLDSMHVVSFRNR